MNELALFAGAGGGILGSQLLGWRVVCAVENDPYCGEVLLRRQEEGILEPFPLWDDVRTFDGKPWRGKVDIITAGFPCQPFSVAGRRKGENDNRNMWPHTRRIICEVQPEWCLLENVPGLVSCGYLGTILGEMAESGYDCRWDCISAAAVGAPHIRERLWVVAHAPRTGIRKQRKRICGKSRENSSKSVDDGTTMSVANSAEFAKRKQNNETDTKPKSRHTWEMPKCRSWWAAEPDVGRVADGVAHRVDRLKSIGNGQVPHAMAAAWTMLGREFGQRGS